MSRKEAINAFKARTVERGIFVVRCTATAQAWVDLSPNLGAARNGNWFALRIGSHRSTSAQAAWTAHGEDTFVFEVLETLSEDESPIVATDLLKTKKREWAARLGAEYLHP